MITDDVYRSRLRATIASLLYWTPSVRHAARIEHDDTADYWRLNVIPHLAGGCPFELILRADQHYDIMIAGEAYEDRPVTTLDIFLPLAEAISDGRVLRRSWVSPATSLQCAVETIVDIGPKGKWHERRETRNGGRVSENAALLGRDRHFLPYRR